MKRGTLMAGGSLHNLSLRDKLKDVEKLTRELSDHLGRGFIPKVQSLRRLSRRATHPDQRDSVSDAAIRESVAAVLKSDEYAQELCQKTRDYLRSIQADVDGMFNT
ncbi:MAG: hypothetical protein KDA52_22650 [Planctomycetaceae bacterium]|nr:hypothetical protein [Planctomycetaceae bacterium]